MTEPDTDAVRLEREGGVARIVLTAPERRNALSVDMARGIVDAVNAVEGSDARVVVLEGEGPAFCAGGDVSMMVDRHEGDEPLADAVRHVARDTGRAVRRVAECEFPTVAKVDGPAFGAGGNLAIACDIQLLSESASIGFGFRNVGLAVDSGTSYLLPRLVGDNVARELVFTGELVAGDRALELGLANHVYADEAFEEEAESFIAGIAEGPSVALRTSKRLLRHGADGSLDAAIENEAAAQAAVLDSEDHAEGVAAFTEGREPEFEGR
ncbi:enoyl-CoA hydratase family protein [Haloparvum alkalitolerans]|uniref:enoyl-CoA hydratase/isomerase family protein n=1 Tax=Haloparvum alkalitolerans TaxID=1042953 RepID=UPI003CEE095A